MKQVTTLFLKLAVIFIGIPVLALCIFLVPHMANFACKIVSKYCPNEISRFHRDVWSGCAFLLCSLSGFQSFTVH